MNTVKFAALVSWLTQCRAQSDVKFSEYELETLQQYISNLTEPNKFAETEIENLLKAMKNGQKIEAIKAYRALTEMGLKESKDAIERYYISQPIQQAV